MKNLKNFSAVMALLIGCAAVQLHATNLIVNGGFEQPSVGSGWSLFSNGSVPGWYNSVGDGSIEIDASGIVGGPAYAGNQSVEVNATTFDTVSQTVTGLVAGDTYTLSWAYGDRPGSGPQEMNVLFGGNLVATNYDLAANNSSLVWTLNSYTVTATAATETLSFQGVNVGGLPSYGNEVDAVSLVQTPEVPTLPLLLTGLGLMSVLWRRQAFQA